jgi:hypothetical protein
MLRVVRGSAAPDAREPIVVLLKPALSNYEYGFGLVLLPTSAFSNCEYGLGVAFIEIGLKNTYYYFVM